MKYQDGQWYANIQGVWYEVDSLKDGHSLIAFYMGAGE